MQSKLLFAKSPSIIQALHAKQCWSPSRPSLTWCSFATHTYMSQDYVVKEKNTHNMDDLIGTLTGYSAISPNYRVWWGETNR